MTTAEQHQAITAIDSLEHTLGETKVIIDTLVHRQEGFIRAALALWAHMERHGHGGSCSCVPCDGIRQLLQAVDALG